MTLIQAYAGAAPKPLAENMAAMKKLYKKYDFEALPDTGDHTADINAAAKSIENAQATIAGARQKIEQAQTAILQDKIASEAYRYEMALENDDVLWMDPDCVTTEAFTFPDDKPSFAFDEAQPPNKPQPEIFLFYSPDKEWWEKIEAERVRRGIEKTTFAFMRKLLRDKDVHRIGPSLYRHGRGQKYNTIPEMKSL